MGKALKRLRVLGWVVAIIILLYLHIPVVLPPYGGTLIILSDNAISDVWASLDGEPLIQAFDNPTAGMEFAWNYRLRSGLRPSFAVHWRTPDGRQLRLERRSYQDDASRQCLHTLRLDASAEVSSAGWSTLCRCPGYRHLLESPELQGDCE